VSKQNFTWEEISVFPQLQLNLLRDPAQFQNGRARSCTSDAQTLVPARARIHTHTIGWSREF